MFNKMIAVPSLIIVLISSAMFIAKADDVLPTVGYACRKGECNNKTAADWDADVLIAEYGGDKPYRWEFDYDEIENPDGLVRDVYWARGDVSNLQLVYGEWIEGTEFHRIELGNNFKKGDMVEILAIDYHENKEDNFLRLVNGIEIYGITTGQKLHRISYDVQQDGPLFIEHRDTLAALVSITKATTTPTPEFTSTPTPTPTNTSTVQPSTTPPSTTATETPLVPTSTPTSTFTPTATETPVETVVATPVTPECESVNATAIHVIGGGQIIMSPDKNVFQFGDTVTFTAVADNGWQFVGWIGVDVPSVTKIVMSIPYGVCQLNVGGQFYKPSNLEVDNESVITHYPRQWLPMVLTN